MGAFINVAAFYIVGIPVASVFAFVRHLGGMVLTASHEPLIWNKLIYFKTF
jgi:hypothetical protein